jgi:hypothetical protein
MVKVILERRISEPESIACGMHFRHGSSNGKAALIATLLPLSLYPEWKQ